MRSVEQFLKEGSKVFQRKAPDMKAVEVHLASADGWGGIAFQKETLAEIRVEAAYNTIHAASLAVIRLLEYRVTSAQGHHAEVIEACCAAIDSGTSVARDAMTLARWRNGKYDGVATTEENVLTALDTMKRFLEAVQEWIKANGGSARPSGAGAKKA